MNIKLRHFDEIIFAKVLYVRGDDLVQFLLKWHFVSHSVIHPRNKKLIFLHQLKFIDRTKIIIYYQLSHCVGVKNVVILHHS